MDISNVLSKIAPRLSDTDDLELWRTVLGIACDDVSQEVSNVESRRDVFLVLGPCSSWLRPHQTLWRVGDMDFAWPSGYGGTAYSRTGLPALDWCCCLQYGRGAFKQIDTPARFEKRQHALRVAIPTTTKVRNKASIHMLWTPGTPGNVRRPLVRLLFMLRENSKWKLFSSSLKSGERWHGELLPAMRK